MLQIPGRAEGREGGPLRQHCRRRQTGGREREPPRRRYLLYGLECVNGNIQDSDNNYTRFICVTKDPVIYAGANKISLIIALDNRPGALYEVLSKLAALDIDMTKLESCPVAGSDFEFIFFLELEASVKDPSVRACLEEMERSCAQFQFLGNYAEV